MLCCAGCRNGVRNAPSDVNVAGPRTVKCACSDRTPWHACASLLCISGAHEVSVVVASCLLRGSSFRFARNHSRFSPQKSFRTAALSRGMFTTTCCAVCNTIPCVCRRASDGYIRIRAGLVQSVYVTGGVMLCSMRKIAI